MQEVLAVGAPTGHPKRRMDATRSAGIPVTPCTSIPEVHGSWPTKWWRMWRAFQSCHRQQLRHLHGVYGYLPALATLCKSGPYIATPMGGDIYFKEQLPRSYCLEALMRRTLRRADIVTVKSDQMAARVKELGVHPQRIALINWGVDTTLFHPDPSQRDPEHPILLSPRAMEPLYQIDRIIQAFAKVSASAQLIVVDHPNPHDPYSQSCHQLAQDLGVWDRIKFIAPRDFSEMPKLYQRADICISVPRSDGLPQSAYEAMACGCACILADLPNYDGVFVHGNTALLFQTEPGVVAEQINCLLQDRELLQRLSQSGRAYVIANASLEKNLADLKDLYCAVEASKWKLGMDPLALL
ncbi:MAG: glycosyltransferase, partial [Chlamydiia bacterium]|nr:glycosyltransferase [Chlamydiia bacterium]